MSSKTVALVVLAFLFVANISHAARLEPAKNGQVEGKSEKLEGCEVGEECLNAHTDYIYGQGAGNAHTDYIYTQRAGSKP